MKIPDKDILFWTKEEKYAWNQYAHEVALKAKYIQRNYPYRRKYGDIKIKSY